MALSIVPILLSLFAPSSTAGNDLVVRVADKDGKPVPGIQVGLCPDWPGHSTTAGIGVSDAEGNVRIEGGLDTVRRDTSHDYFVRLGMPADPDVRVDLDRAHLDTAHPLLVVPEHGHVVLKLPAIAADGCAARLRRAPRTPEEKRAIWSGSSLPQILSKNRLATVEFVGLDLDLEYEVRGASLPQPLRGTLRGPSKSGEVVTFEVPGFESVSKLRARLVDEDSKPVGRVRLEWGLGWHTESEGSGSAGTEGGEVVTDELGFVVIPISDKQASQPNRTLTLSTVFKATRGMPFHNSSVRFTIPNEFRAGELNLGQQALAPFGSAKKFRGLDDKALEERFLTLDDSWGAVEDEGDGHVEILCEMIRRGGAELEHFVAECADRVPHVNGRRPWGDADELCLRTVLARMRKQPDPVSVLIGSRSMLDVTYPELPSVDCVVVNAAASEHSFPLSAFRTCYWIEAYDGSGTELRQRTVNQYEGWDSGLELQPGQFHQLDVDLGRLVFPGPGEYRLRIHYAPNEYSEPPASTLGHVVLSTAEFSVRIQSCDITLTQARMEALRTAVRGLDLDIPVPLVHEHWSGVLDFRDANDEPVETVESRKALRQPEGVLFRAGREALPALHEALEDSGLDPKRRAWVFAMLWNIAGTYHPHEREWRGSIGPSRLHTAWPKNSAPDWRRGFEIDAYAVIDGSKQADLTERWLETKAYYQLKIVP